MAANNAEKIAVVGATGAVGREILTALAERGVAAAQVVALASGRSAGGEVSYGDDDDLLIQSVDAFDFKGVQAALFAAGTEASKKFVAVAAKAGAVVIDTSPAFRLEPGVPLVVPGVNIEDLEGFAKKRIVAVPGPAGQALLTVLAPLLDGFGVEQASATALYSASTQGREAMDELFAQTRGIYVNEPPSGSRAHYPKQIAFNVIPQVEGFASHGATQEEERLASEVIKALDPELNLHANAACVPGFVGISGFLSVSLRREGGVEAVRAALRAAPGITVVDHRADGGYATPVECVGEDAVFVSRVRVDHSRQGGISLWWCADNQRLVALNVVKILETLQEQWL